MLGFGSEGQFSLCQGAAAPPVVNVAAQWPGSLSRKALSVAVIATTFVGFVPPVAQTPTVFTKFSELGPGASRAPQAAWLFNPAQPSLTPPIFASFSQPAFTRGNLPDEQSSALFEALPPQSPPFTGFAQFTGLFRVKANPSTGFQSFLFVPSTPDTHDLVFDVFRKKKPRRDLIDEELARKAKLRAGLELAAYGPPLEISYDSIPEALPVAAPPDVAGLTKTILQVQEAQQQAMRAQQIADEEDDLEMILKELG